MPYRNSDETDGLLVVAFGGNVMALDLHTGATRWDVEDGSRTHRVLVRDREVFLVGERLLMLELATGRCRYATELPAAVTFGTVLVDGDHIVVGDGGQVACFARSDGRMLWHNPFQGRGLGLVALATRRGAMQADHS